MSALTREELLAGVLCRTCGQTKPVEAFGWRKDLNKPKSACKACACKKQKASYAQMRAKTPYTRNFRVIEAGRLQCRKCHEKKVLTEFQTSQQGVGYQLYCKQCQAEDALIAYRKARAEGPVPIPPDKKAYIKAYQQAHREKLLLRKRLGNRARTWKVKLIVLEHYGACCACCGESNPYFLQIDHINGDGAQHRRLLRTKPGHNFYRWLIQQDFPTGFRILCANCNTARGYYGFCPHEGGGIQLAML